MRLIRDNATRAVPRPLIIEMGGKNPALIMRSADLDKATDGVMRSAFGAQGQKCSACSRVYVSRKQIRDEFVRLLVEKTKKIKIGNPLKRDVYLGPVINEEAVKTYERAVAAGQAGRRDDPDRRPAPDRRRASPTATSSSRPSSTACRSSHPLFSEELFVPITLIGRRDDARRGDRRWRTGPNTASPPGIFSEDDREIDAVLRAHSGGRHLRQPPRRRHDRRLAGDQLVRRLEGQRVDGTRDRRAILRAAVHARAEPGANPVTAKIGLEPQSAICNLHLICNSVWRILCAD